MCMVHGSAGSCTTPRGGGLWRCHRQPRLHVPPSLQAKAAIDASQQQGQAPLSWADTIVLAAKVRLPPCSACRQTACGRAAGCVQCPALRLGQRDGLRALAVPAVFCRPPRSWLGVRTRSGRLLTVSLPAALRVSPACMHLLPPMWPLCLAAGCCRGMRAPHHCWVPGTQARLAGNGWPTSRTPMPTAPAHSLAPPRSRQGRGHC